MTDDIRAQQILNELGLGHLVEHYSMDGEQQNWSQILSIGEQQRLMMVTAFLVGIDIVQLFVLDETTSGCDQQTEESYLSVSSTITCPIFIGITSKGN